MEEAFVHSIGGCVVMTCECGNFDMQSMEDSAGCTDELEFHLTCKDCGKEYKVKLYAYIVGD